MENYGIALSIPFCYLAAAVYCALLPRIVSAWPRLRMPLLLPSLVVLGSLIGEMVLLATLGAVRSRGLLGPGFTMAHTALILLSVPALANILVLQRRIWWLREWYLAAVFCALLGLTVVVMQYAVNEALFGMDGTGGAYPGPW